MGFLNKLFGKKEIIIYSDPLWTDCQKAESFFADHGIPVKIKNIEDEQVQREMQKKFNRIMTPTIIINGEAIIGFEQNIEKIKQLLN